MTFSEIAALDYAVNGFEDVGSIELKGTGDQEGVDRGEVVGD